MNNLDIHHFLYDFFFFFQLTHLGCDFTRAIRAKCAKSLIVRNYTWAITPRALPWGIHRKKLVARAKQYARKRRLTEAKLSIKIDCPIRGEILYYFFLPDVYASLWYYIYCAMARFYCFFFEGKVIKLINDRFLMFDVVRKWEEEKGIFWAFVLRAFFFCRQFIGSIIFKYEGTNFEIMVKYQVEGVGAL